MKFHFLFALFFLCSCVLSFVVHLREGEGVEVPSVHSQAPEICGHYCLCMPEVQIREDYFLQSRRN